MRKRLGMEKAQGLTYLDLPATASQGYSSILMGSRVLLGMGDLFGVPSPAMVVPTFDALRPHFAPAGSVTRFDDGGMLFRHVTPFPGADLFGVQGQAMLGQSMASNAMMISILLPSLNRARETANRVKSASNLRQMGQGMLLYANENKGKYPPDAATLRKYMAELLSEQEVTQVFDSPLGRGPGGEDYVYLYFDGLDNRVSAEVIVAYDAAALNRPDGRDGTNVLFGDGHVEWEHPDTLRRAIERSRELEPKSVPQEISIPGPGAGPGARPPGPSARPRPIPPRPPTQHPARSRPGR
jgi:prepilin-type processing-associated H-X9-DG protein